MFCLNSCHTGGWWGLFTSWMSSPWARFQCFDLQVTFLSCHTGQHQTGESIAIQQHTQEKEKMFTARNRNVPGGMKYIYKDIDFVSNYLCSWFFLYLWGREAYPLDFGILQLSSFVLISVQASSPLHELSLPPGGHGSRCTLVPLNEGGGQQIDIVLVTHVLTGLNTHFPTALQVTGFFESMIKTTRKYSRFSMYKTDPTAWSSNNWFLKKLALELCLYQANSHWNQGWKSVHLMCYIKTVLLGLPHKTNHTFCLQLEEWKIKHALWRA